MTSSSVMVQDDKQLPTMFTGRVNKSFIIGSRVVDMEAVVVYLFPSQVHVIFLCFL